MQTASSAELAAGSHILLVVDDDVIGHAALEALRSAPLGLPVHRASGLPDALRHIESSPPGLVVCASRLAGVDAEQLLPPVGVEPTLPFLVIGPAVDEPSWLARSDRGVLDFVPSDPPFLERLPAHASRALREWRHVLASRQAERMLLEREGYYRRLVEHTQDIITILGSDFTIHYQSPSIARLLGYDPLELRRLNALDLVHPKDQPRVVDAMARARANPQSVQRVEYRFRHKDGSWRVLESVGRWGSGDPIGNTERHIVTSRDITARLAAEAERTVLEVQLHHAQRLETIGTLAGGIAHDFNNILTSLFGFAGLVLDALPTDSPAHYDMSQVLRAADRAKDLVRRILTFSRQVEPERRPVVLSEVIDEALSLARASLPSSIVIEADLGTGGGQALADPSQLHQVVLNLCTNAAHAMRDSGGVMRIALRPVELSEGQVMEAPGLRPGSYHELEVTDTGHGMEQGTLERIFDPFFTTKPKGEGTGLGLAVVHGIVASHGGRITAMSEPGQGTRFSVLLPAAQSVSMPSRPRPAMTSGHERILFVDDEADILVPLHRLLLAAGYAVELATGGPQAIALVTANPQGFDLVITDRTMPGMSGIELAQTLHGVRADLPIVLVSGFGATVDDLSSGVLRAALAKPFTFQELSATIRRVLDEQL